MNKKVSQKSRVITHGLFAKEEKKNAEKVLYGHSSLTATKGGPIVAVHITRQKEYITKKRWMDREDRHGNHVRGDFAE